MPSTSKFMLAMMNHLLNDRVFVTLLTSLSLGLLTMTGCKTAQDPWPPPAQNEATTSAKPWSFDDVFKGGPLIEPDPTTGVWSAAPVAVNIYPGTRFIMEDDKPILDAGLELVDDMGDSVKAPGTARFELYESGTGDTLGRRLYAWDVNVLTPADQRTYYNRVIRAYNFRLGVDDLEAQKVPTILQVSYDLANGNRLQTREKISTDW